MSKIPSVVFADAKPHYLILDGLRGVAAIIVVWFHIFEAYATNHLDQIVNHGYLAVDFFFVLSGFVIGYAYNDRWGTLSIKDFIKRRFIRLHPMVIMGAIIGAVLYYFQDYSQWNVSETSILMLLGAMILNMFLIPATPTTEIRGLGEMYPLNGPSWSLFFEYIGNILYAFFLRKLPTKILSVWVALAGCGLAIFAIWGPYGDICAGWTMTGQEMIGGSFRLLFSFSAGLLLSRIFKPIKVQGIFWIGSLVFILLTAMPRLGGSENLWANGLYEMFCVLIIFPLLVIFGASETTTTPLTARICKFLGNISYPLYMVHYPFIYIYYAWVKDENLTFTQSIYGALALVMGCMVLAYLCLKLYDEPIRKLLIKRFFKR